MNAWANLPNAVHIDAILADARARTHIWDAAWAELCGAETEEAWDAALDISLYGTWEHSKVSAMIAAAEELESGIAASDAALGAICALIAWPESAGMLDLPIDALRAIAGAAGGAAKRQAALLLPAVIARSTP